MSNYESLSQLYDTNTDTFVDNDVANIQEVCSQRRIGMLFNTPPPRFTPVNPYTKNANGQLNFTKQQLDMRRKVEILRYDKSSTQGNKPTKKEQWSHINTRKTSIRKSVGNISLLPGVTVASGVDCSTVPTSSKQANVPGPAITLQLDKSVPLYNYGSPVRSFGILDKNNTEPYEVISNGQIKTFYDDSYGFLACLKILDSIDETSKLFQLSLPFTLGYSKNNGISSSLDISGSIYVNAPATGNNTTKIYYSGTETNSGTHTFQMDNSGTIFSDSSANTVESGLVGTIIIDNIFAQTQPNYFYEIAQRFDLVTDISLGLVTPCLKINMESVEVTTN
jgi:hypothetical protein